MKVKELIELLQRQDPDERVGIVVYENDGEQSSHKEVESVRWDGSEPRVRVGIVAGFIFADPMT